MMKNILLVSIFIASLTTSWQTFAQQSSPYTVVSTIGQKLFARISNAQTEKKLEAKTMQGIVQEELMPHIDYRYVAYKILGKNLKTINKEQREKFVDSMALYLTKTYASALSQYDNQKVTFEPESAFVGKKIVPVRALITDDGRPTITMEFKMRQNTKTLEWKAFDMVVEGISLLDTKQAEIGNRIRSVGIEQVTDELVKHAE